MPTYNNRPCPNCSERGKSSAGDEDPPLRESRRDPGRVLAVRPAGECIHLQAVGTKSQQFSSRIASPADPARVSGRNVQGREKVFFPETEDPRSGWRSNSLSPFAPYVSPIDPLPYPNRGHRPLHPEESPGPVSPDRRARMAGPLLKEFRNRGLIQRTLIVAPSDLEDHWQREMKKRFDEALAVVDRGGDGRHVAAQHLTEPWRREHRGG